jgi:hypothetical protein
MGGAIFLSYRRDDAEGQAGRLYGDLVAVFGRDAVFMDVTAIEPGRDFRKAIEQSLSSCGVFLTLIGKNWLTAKDESGRCRLDDHADFVRIEIAAALKRDIPVVPVLLQGTAVPKPDQLSDDLKDLAFRNAIELSHSRWDSDVRVLIDALRPLISMSGREPKSLLTQRASFLNFKLIAAAALAVVIVAVLTFYLRSSKKPVKPPNDALTEIKRSSVSQSTQAKPASATSTLETTHPRVRKSAATNAVGRSATASESNAAPAPDQFSIAAERRPLPDNPNRYKFGVWLKARRTLLDEISRVHYDFIYDPNPLSIEGAPDPPFGATYEGWGCYETVNITVYFKPGELQPVKKTFDMCKALPQ